MFDLSKIETPRLVLRPAAPEEWAAVQRAEEESREHLRRYMPWADRAGPEPVHEVVAKLRLFRARLDRAEDLIFSAFLDGAIVGSVGLHNRCGIGGLEIGYWVHAAHVRQGLAFEMAAAMTRVIFEHEHMRWAEIRCAGTNEASQGVPLKLGYTREAVLKERFALPNGTIEDAVVFSLFARDYATSPARRVEVTIYDASGQPRPASSIV